jgi:N-acetylmuramoyl-L-alanine amidase
MQDIGLKKTRSILLIFIFTGISFLQAGEGTISIYFLNSEKYISLVRLKKEIPFSTSFDIITGRGRIYYSNHSVRFLEGSAAAIIDNTLYVSSSPVMRKNGEIFLPVDMAQKITLLLFHKKITVKNSQAYIADVTQRVSGTHKTRKVLDPITFIIIDPGHGGKDPGAVSGKLYEKRITLSIAKKLAAKLQKKYRHKKIYLTRNRDRFLSLGARTEYANKKLKRRQNGLFISIHANASISRSISGFETYYLSQNASNESARKTAALENNVIILEDSKQSRRYKDVEFIEAIMITTQIQKESRILAQEIQSGIDRNISRFASRGVRKADFYVLRGVLMPAVLIETGFITHKRESRYLNDSKHQDRIVEGIVRGVTRFIKKYNNVIH